MPATKAKAPAPLRKPATLDHLRKQRRLSSTVSFCLEDLPEPKAPSLNAPIEQRKAHEAAIKAWRSAVEEATVELVVKALSRRDYQDLLEAHPPSQEQIDRAERAGLAQPDNDTKSFIPALLAASIVEPEGITVEDAENIWNGWPTGDAETLANACILLNRTSRLEYYQGKSVGIGG